MPSDLSDQLRSKGYRLTPARQLVLGAVAVLEHATPDAICAEVQRTASSVNLSTVYRTLELLEELGLVSHTHLGHGAPIYHAAHEREHLHLVCGSCGRILESPSDCASTLIAQLRADLGFETDIAHFALYGRCAECRAADAADGHGQHTPGEHSDSDDEHEGDRGNNGVALEG
ncbi:transcriptional repressor [Actinospica durhamensis]|uniref:Transcriptional repressor n=1 Tax=Actinospica durhamensis TaxID=1508375 RepID=A0A941ILZ6_9ACTN|nr:transcriptional repressor [Actinospica durhamensis]